MNRATARQLAADDARERLVAEAIRNAPECSYGCAAGMYVETSLDGDIEVFCAWCDELLHVEAGPGPNEAAVRY